MLKEDILKKIKKYAEKNNGVLEYIVNDDKKIDIWFCFELKDYKNFLNDLSKEGIKINEKMIKPQKTYIV